MRVHNLRRFLSLYLSVAMVVTQVVPFGWAQENTEATGVRSEDEIKTVALEDADLTAQPDVVSAKPLDQNIEASTDFLMGEMLVKAVSAVNPADEEVAEESVLSVPQAETLDKASQIQIEGEIRTLETDVAENALDAEFRDAEQLKEKAEQLIQDYLKLENPVALEVTRLTHPMASYEQAPDLDENTAPSAVSRRGEVLLTQRNQDGSSTLYTVGIEAGQLFLTQIEDQTAEGRQTRSVYLSYNEDGTLSYRSTTLRAFDIAGNIIEESYESETANTETHELEKNSSSMTLTTYDDQGHVLSRISSSSSSYKDANGVVQNSESSNESYSEYDDAGHLLRQEQYWESLLNGVSQSSGFTITENEYDDAGLQIKSFTSSESTWGDNQSSRWSSEQAFVYDAQGHLVREVTSTKNSSPGWKNESETIVSYKLDEAGHVLAKISESKGSSNGANTWSNRVEETFAYDAAGNEILHKTAYSYNGQANSESVTKREFWKDAKGNITDKLLSEVMQSFSNGKLSWGQETKNAYSPDGILLSSRLVSRYYQYDTGKESSRNETLKFFNREGKIIKLSNRNFYDNGNGRLTLSSRSDQSFFYDNKTGHLRMVRGSEYGQDGRKASEWIEKYDPAFSAENGMPEQGPLYYYPLASVSMIYPYPYQNPKAGLIERKFTSFLYTEETGLARNVSSVQADRYTLNDKGEPVTQESLVESYDDHGKLMSRSAEVYQITGPLYPNYYPYYDVAVKGVGLAGSATGAANFNQVEPGTASMMADRSSIWRGYPVYIQNRRLLKKIQEHFENGTLVYSKRLTHEYDHDGVLLSSSAEIMDGDKSFRIHQEYRSDAVGRFAQVHRIVTDLMTGEVLSEETRTFEFEKAVSGGMRVYPVMYDEALSVNGAQTTASGKMMMPAYYPYYWNNYAVKSMHVDIRLSGQHVSARIDYTRANSWEQPQVASVKGIFEDVSGESHDLEGTLENPGEEIYLPAESLAKKLIALAKIVDETNTDAERSIDALMESLDLSALSKDQIEEIRKAIVIKSVQGPMTWNNGCVGFPTSGPCTMALVTGYIVTLRLFENEYIFHAGRMHPESVALVAAINRLIKDGYDLKSIARIVTASQDPVELAVATSDQALEVSNLKNIQSLEGMDQNYPITLYAGNEHFEFDVDGAGRIHTMLHLDSENRLLHQEFESGEFFDFEWASHTGMHVKASGEEELFEAIDFMQVSESTCPANPMMKVACRGWVADRAVQEGFEDVTTYTIVNISGGWKKSASFVITGRRIQKAEFIPVDKMDENLVAQIRKTVGDALELTGMRIRKEKNEDGTVSLVREFIFRAVSGESHLHLLRQPSVLPPGMLKDPSFGPYPLPGDYADHFLASITVNPNIRYIQAPSAIRLDPDNAKGKFMAEVIPGQEIVVVLRSPVQSPADAEMVSLTLLRDWEFSPLALQDHFRAEISFLTGTDFKSIHINSFEEGVSTMSPCKVGAFCPSVQTFNIVYDMNGVLYKTEGRINNSSEMMGMVYEISMPEIFEDSEPHLVSGIPVEGVLEMGPDGPSTLMRDVYYLRLASGAVILIDRANPVVREMLDGFVGQKVKIAGDVMALEGQQILQAKVVVMGSRAILFSDGNKVEYFTDVESLPLSHSVCPANTMMGMPCTASAQRPIPEGFTVIHRYVVTTNNGTTITTEEIAIIGKPADKSNAFYEEALQKITSILGDMRAKAGELEDLRLQSKDLEAVLKELTAKLNGKFEPELIRLIRKLALTYVSVINQLATMQEGLKAAIASNDHEAADRILKQLEIMSAPPIQKVTDNASAEETVEEVVTSVDGSVSRELGILQDVQVNEAALAFVQQGAIERAFDELNRFLESARKRLAELPGLIEDLKAKIEARTQEYRATEQKILESYQGVLKFDFVKAGGAFKEEVFGEFRGHGDVLMFPRHLIWVEEAFYEAVLANGDVLKLNFQNGVFNPMRQGLLDAIQLAMHDGKIQDGNFVIASDSFTKSFNGGFSYSIEGFEHILGIKTEKQGIVKLLAYSTSQPFAENTVTSFDGEFSTESLTDALVAASDANKDGVINNADLQMVLTALYQKWSWRSGTEPAGIDVNGDGAFDVLDALIVRASFDRKVPPVISYPLASEKEFFEQMKLLKFYSASQDGDETHSYDFFVKGAGEVHLNVVTDGCFGWNEPNMSCTRPAKIRQLIIKISDAYQPQMDTASGGLVGIDLYSVDMDAQGDAVEIRVPAGFHFRLFNLARNMSLAGFEEIPEPGIDIPALVKDARGRIDSLIHNFSISEPMTESEFENKDAAFTGLGKNITEILMKLRDDLKAGKSDSFVGNGIFSLTDVSPAEALELQRYATEKIRELYGRLMETSVVYRNAAGADIMVPVKYGMLYLKMALEDSGLPSHGLPEGYLKLKGLTPEIVGNFNIMDGLRDFRVFGPLPVYELIAGPSARDLRNIMIRLAKANESFMIKDGLIQDYLWLFAIHGVQQSVTSALDQAYQDAAVEAGVSFFRKPELKVKPVDFRATHTAAYPLTLEIDLVYTADKGSPLKATAYISLKPQDPKSSPDALQTQVKLITPPFGSEPPVSPADAVLLTLAPEVEPVFNGYNAEGKTFPYVGYGRMLEDHTVTENGVDMREVSFISDVASAAKAVADMVLVPSGAAAMNLGGKIKFFLKGEVSDLFVVLRDADGKELVVQPVKAGAEYGEVAIAIPAGIDASKIDSISLRHRNGNGIARRGRIFVKCGLPVRKAAVTPVQDPFVAGGSFDRTQLTDISGSRGESFGRNRNSGATPGFITLKDGSFRFHLPSQSSEVGVIYTLPSAHQDYSGRDFVLALGDNGAKSLVEVWFQDKSGNTVKRMLRLGEQLQNFSLKLTSGEVEGFDASSVVAWGMKLAAENCKSSDRKGEITFALGGQAASSGSKVGNSNVSATALAYLTNLAGQVRKDSKYITPVITQDAEGNRELTIRYNIKNASRDEGAFVLKAASGGLLPVQGDELKFLLTGQLPETVKLTSPIKVGLRIKDQAGHQITKILDIVPGASFSEYSVNLKDFPQIDKEKIQEMSFEFNRQNDASHLQGSIKLKLAKEFKLV